MALSITQCPKINKFPQSNYFLKATSLPPHSTCLRFSRLPSMRATRVICAAFSSAAGNSDSSRDSNPYEVLGVNPIEGFDRVKAAYTKKRKDAERRGDEAAAAELEKAYDKIMMSQLSKRKKGETFGSFRVSKDVKYADKQPLIPWGPRYAKSEVNDIKINMAISAVFTVWILISGNADYKPLQFLTIAFVYRIFEKLKASEPSTSPSFNEDGTEDEGRTLRMGKRLIRSLALVFGCVAFASLGFTGVVNTLESALGFVPLILYNNQELFVTATSALMLYILASYYR